MRQIKYYIGSMLLAMVAMTACQDDFDNPGLATPEATISANTSILDLKTKYWNFDDENYTDDVVETQDHLNYIAKIGVNDEGERIVISGRVVSSDRSGNIYKNLVIQDETAAIALSINQSGLYNNYRIGQEVVIDATDMFIGKYNGLEQLGYPDYSEQYGWQASFMPFALFLEHSQLNGLPDEALVDTVTVSIPEVKAAEATSEGLIKWQSRLVRLNNVRFEEGDGSLCYTDGSEINSNRTLYDENGNSITVRNSGYASFWSDKLPAGYGDVVGILSYYYSSSSSGWQILLRSTNDCMNFGNPTIEPGKEDNPYTVPQVIAKEEASASASGWVTGYIVGAVAPEVETVTSNDDIEWGAPTVLKNTLVIAPAADVKEITQCLVISLPQDSKLREYANLVDNESVLGRQIWLLGTFEKYMGTWGITGNRGTADEFRIEGVEIADGSIAAGNGSESTPYNVPQVQEGASGSGVWVAGYIVGWVDGMTLATGATFGVPANSKTNLLIANSPSATSVEECVPVQLPSSIRSGLNLQDNPGNLGKKLYIKGNLVKYFGTNGVKEATEYRLEGEGSGGSVPETPVNPVTSLNETFEGVSSVSDLSGWTSKVVAGNKAWYFTSFDNNYYAACTAYKGTDDGNGYDSWLITPPLNVDGMSSKILSFESQAAYSGGSFEIYAMTAADPATATLTKLNCTLATPPASGYSGFVSSGDISLSNFSGVIYIGFRYIAETSASSMTFCIDNVKAGISGGSTPETPEDPVTPPATGDNVADFNTFNDGTPKSSYATYTTAAGWTAENSAILGGSDDATAANNPNFGFIGSAGTLAPTLNGKTTAPGKLTSPTLTGGIKTLSFNYGFAYSDTQCSISINIKQNGEVVKTEPLNITEITKQKAYSYSIDINVEGDFVIEIVNNCVSAESKNKDRISIWNMSWTN